MTNQAGDQSFDRPIDGRVRDDPAPGPFGPATTINAYERALEHLAEHPDAAAAREHVLAALAEARARAARAEGAKPGERGPDRDPEAGPEPGPAQAEASRPANGEERPGD